MLNCERYVDIGDTTSVGRGPTAEHAARYTLGSRPKAGCRQWEIRLQVATSGVQDFLHAKKIVDKYQPTPMVADW